MQPALPGIERLNILRRSAALPRSLTDSPLQNHQSMGLHVRAWLVRLS
jgi:hypothetical protein